jgi:hypothetical protein
MYSPAIFFILVDAVASTSIFSTAAVKVGEK